MLVAQFPVDGMIILQASGQPAGALQMGLLAYEVVGALLGVFIAYLAYRGYRRNQSRPMLFISVGFILVLALPLAITLLYLALPIIRGQVAVQITNQTLEIAGLVSIIYALRA